MTHEQQLFHPLYRNWVKSGLGLKYLKYWLDNYVDNEAKSMHADFHKDICLALNIETAFCNNCTNYNVIECPTYGICNVRKKSGICDFHDKNDTAKTYKRCPKNICNRLYEKVNILHAFKKPSMRNCNASKWCNEHWEIAKCFLNGSGYEDKHSSNEVDCSGFISIVTNCLQMHTSLETTTNDCLTKVIKIRNDIFHSHSLHVKDEELEEYISTMLTILQDKKIVNNPCTITAKNLIEKLRDTSLCITTEDEYDMRQNALRAIQEKRKEAIVAIELKQDSVCHEIQKIQDKYSGHWAEKRTEMEVSQIKTSLEKLESKQDTLEERVGVLEIMTAESTSKLTDSISEIQQEIRHLKKHDEDILEKTHERRVNYLKNKQDLVDGLCEMYETHLSTLPLSPINAELNVPVDDVFSELMICDDIMQESKILKCKQSNMKKVKNYNCIFLKDEKPVKNIYVLGDAGIGKTTWCMNLLRKWLYIRKKKSNDNIENANITEDERAMFEFDIVIYLSLRHASGNRNIRKMIQRQLIEKNSSHEKSLLDVIEQEPHKCLIVLDGLDEWSCQSSSESFRFENPNLPSRKSLQGCTFLTTSRPWKVDQVCMEKRDVDRAIRIQGLTRQTILAEKVIKQLNEKVTDCSSQNEHRTYHEFRNKVQTKFYHYSRLRDLPPFLEVPLILYFMVCLWFDEGIIETSMAANYSALLSFLIKRAEGNRGNTSQKLNKSTLKRVKKRWRERLQFLPDCLKKRQNCVELSYVLISLSSLAGDTLFGKHEDKSLVFSDETLEQRLSLDILEVAVKIGIVSQSKVVQKNLTTYVEFIFSPQIISRILCSFEYCLFNKPRRVRCN